jgi:hypothetical protein
MSLILGVARRWTFNWLQGVTREMGLLARKDHIATRRVPWQQCAEQRGRSRRVRGKSVRICAGEIQNALNSLTVGLLQHGVAYAKRAQANSRLIRTEPSRSRLAQVGRDGERQGGVGNICMQPRLKDA